MNRKAFSRINYGLFIVGAELDGKPQGCIVNSLHQVTSSMPFKFSLTVNKSNETFKAIEAKGALPPRYWPRIPQRIWSICLAISPAG